MVTFIRECIDCDGPAHPYVQCKTCDGPVCEKCDKYHWLNHEEEELEDE